VIIGRITTFVAMVLAILWSSWLGRFESIYQGVVALICYIAPPITAVFLWGIFWKRASARGSIVTLISGSAFGFIVFMLDWFKNVTGWNVPPMMATFYLFVVCSLVLVAVSTAFPHAHTQASEKLVWKNPAEALRAPGWKGIGNYKFLSVLLFFIMVILYILFA
jgi:SSS family solute:Na+ symporter